MRGVLLWITGAVDIGYAIHLTVGIVQAATYLPTAPRDCNGAADWRNATDGRNLFVELVDAGHYDTAKDACKDMNMSWIFTIVVV